MEDRRAKQEKPHAVPNPQPDTAPIKSLLVSGSYFPPQVGGISRMMAEICAHLGSDRIAAVSSRDGAYLRSAPHRLRTYHSLNAFDAACPTRLAHLALLLGRAIRRERPTLLQFAGADDAWIGWYTARLLRLPHLIYAHGNEILALARSTWQKPLVSFRAARLIIANSRFTAKQVEEKLGVPGQRIRIIHPACDTRHFRPVAVPAGWRQRLAGRENAYPLLLSVGNLVERKGHDLVLRALAELRQRFPRIAYAIVGNGRDRGKLEHLAQTLGVADCVNFLGRGDDADLATCYSACDLFVMPSRAILENDDVEGFGMVFLEAAACGKAVIGGRSGGIEDAIDEGRSGFLVDPHDPTELIGAITALAQSPELAARFGQAGQHRVAEDFTWEKYGRQIDEVLDELSADGTIRPAKAFHAGCE